MSITRSHGSSAAVGNDAAVDPRKGGVRADDLSSASLAAIAALLAADCGVGQQLMLIAAIRRDTRIDLSDAEIKDLICEAIEEGWTPDATLARLVALDAGSDGIRGADCYPR